jgi:methylmalonyl-CoA mutase cobalamin-binding domain/chain
MIETSQLKLSMGELDEDTVIRMMEQVMDEGGADAQAALEACREGMNIVGDLFQAGDYFVADLIFAGDLMTRAIEIIKPALARSTGGEKVGKMVFCTVKNDLHDIGKNIVKAMLEASGFEVIDLGIDVAAETIVQAAIDNDVKIVALSGVLTLAIDSMKATVEAFKEAGLRDKVKIIVGGAPVTAEYCEYIGADDWSLNPAKTVEICRSWATA